MKFSDQETRQFQAETKKLLHIVAKSIYTDKEVFVRELLSNCSDALEKQRYKELKGLSKMHGEDGLRIEVDTDSKQRTITLFDTGVGMTKEEAVNNLGTIAKSGSKEFLETLDDHTGEESDALQSIIGQFGVGFYSSFIVADKVEVYTRSEGGKGVAWVSDGDGSFVVSDASNLDFERGTKIVIKLKPDAREFCQEAEIEKIITKFS
jgi:TNF receptor-associated protein 1